jgi:transcriptional regulator with XRE-family HTH domain
MATRNRLAKFLLLALADRGESPDQFARRVGINSSGFYKFLRGEYAEPRTSTLRKIAAGLNMTLVQLARVTEALPLEGERLDPELALVVAAWPRLTPGLREAIRILAGNVPPDQLGRDMPDPIYQGPKIPKIPDWKKYKPSRKMDPLLIQPWH